MNNVTNDRKAFWTRGEITRGSLNASGYEQEEEAEEGGHNESSRVIRQNPYQMGDSTVRRVLGAHWNENQDENSPSPRPLNENIL